MAALPLAQRRGDSKLFREAWGDVQLIEIDDGGSSRKPVTKELVERYIVNDFRDAKATLEPVHGPPSTMTLKLFYSYRHGPFDGSISPIPMREDLFEKIAPYARIPSTYLEVLSRSSVMHICTFPRVPPISVPASHKSVSIEYLSFIIQSIPRVERGVSVSASFTFHFPTRHMYIFMHGLQDANYERFCELIEHGATKESPLLIACMLVQFNLENRVQTTQYWHRRIKACEVTMGVHREYSSPDADITKLDLGALVRDVQDMTTNIAFTVWGCNTTKRQLDFLDGVVEKWSKLAERTGYETDEVEEVTKMLTEAIEYLRCWNASLEERAEYLGKRGQALFQTVYSGIAQRDSALSHKVAIAAGRDSAVMRVITAITMLFLPATFTATFFSTSFFDFQVGKHEQVYSWWLWLYWVVTIALTVAVMTSALIWWRRKEDEIARNFVKENKRKT